MENSSEKEMIKEIENTLKKFAILEKNMKAGEENE